MIGYLVVWIVGQLQNWPPKIVEVNPRVVVVTVTPKPNYAVEIKKVNSPTPKINPVETIEDTGMERAAEPSISPQTQAREDIAEEKTVIPTPVVQVTNMPPANIPDPTPTEVRQITPAKKYETWPGNPVE